MNKTRLYVISAVLLLAVIAVGLTLYFTSRTETSKTTAEYIVKAGDTCRKIAFEHNVSAESLIELNNLAPDCSNLTIDQKLIIPAPTP